MQRLMTLVNKMANSQEEKVRDVARIVANIICHVPMVFIIAPAPPILNTKILKYLDDQVRHNLALN